MSRSHGLIAAGALAASLSAGPALAAAPPADRVDAMIERAHRAYSVRERPDARHCNAGSGGGGEIVVCAPDDGADQRVPSTAESDPGSREARHALDNGIPRADVGTHYPGPVVATGCFIPPCPKPPAYVVDFSRLPEPPAGSDAARIASGAARGP